MCGEDIVETDSETVIVQAGRGKCCRVAEQIVCRILRDDRVLRFDGVLRDDRVLRFDGVLRNNRILWNSRICCRCIGRAQTCQDVAGLVYVAGDIGNLGVYAHIA